VPEIEIAWAAGLFDGEGCSHVHRLRSGKQRPRCHVTQKTPEVLYRFLDAVGFGRVRRDGDRWRWWAEDGQARAAMLILLPYLSSPKRTQWENVLSQLAPS
jgi:hypothetical protein